MHVIGNNLFGEMLSPSVLLAVTSGKNKLKLLFLLKFSSWSANRAIFFLPRKNSATYVRSDMTPPSQHTFLNAFDDPPPKCVSTLWMPLSHY